MELESAIHQRWGEDASLSALMPVERLFTGLALGHPAMPYATLTRVGSRVRLHTSSGTRVDDVTLRVSIWTHDLDEGHAIAAAVNGRFDRSSFDLNGASVTQMCCFERREEQSADGMWQVVLEFVAMVQSEG